MVGPSGTAGWGRGCRPPLLCMFKPLRALGPAEYLAREGVTSADFFAAAKAATDAGDVGPEAVFVNLLLATSDYQSFLMLMKAEADEAAADEAAAKLGGGDD